MMIKHEQSCSLSIACSQDIILSSLLANLGAFEEVSPTNPLYYPQYTTRLQKAEVESPPNPLLARRQLCIVWCHVSLLCVPRVSLSSICTYVRPAKGCEPPWFFTQRPLLPE